jgi:hypothetical protein
VTSRVLSSNAFAPSAPSTNALDATANVDSLAAIGYNDRTAV